MILTRSDLMALLPLIIVAASAVSVMLVAGFYRRSQPVMVLTLLGLIISLAALPLAASFGPRQVTPLLIMDNYSGWSC